MDDFIFPEEIDEENIDAMDLDASESGVTISGGDNRESRPKSGNILSVGCCAQAMNDTLQKYEEVKKRIAEVDQLAMQENNFTILVDGAMTGQNAINIVKSFNETVAVTGTILTCIDDDALRWCCFFYANDD
ncbi:unnamed protein product [Acanthocheilonema viteae]|uniref:SRP54-type proteins GTP-binding domain-containing protein n=1 Tax=Acanthocheilonema viteae TaxID=6277 RepID=A0A498SIV9_ACAVI|nr:unnamed protein product [Acanthocheilonema viteae]